MGRGGDTSIVGQGGIVGSAKLTLLAVVLVGREGFGPPIEIADRSASPLGLSHQSHAISGLINALEVVLIGVARVAVAHGDAIQLLVALYQGLQSLLITEHTHLEAALMQAVGAIHADISHAGSSALITLLGACSQNLIVLAQMVTAGLRMCANATLAPHARGLLQVALALVLLDHQVDRLLGIIQVELVVLGLALLRVLLLVIHFAIVASVILSSLSVVCLGGDALGSL